MSRKQRKKRNSYQFLTRKIPTKMHNKLAFLFLLVVLAFAILIGRITYINAAKGSQYTRQVLDQQSYGSRTIQCKRGDIVDSKGTKLATSERVYNVILDVKVLLSTTENNNLLERAIEETTALLVDLFEIEESEIAAALENKPDSQYVILKKEVDYNTAKIFEQYQEENSAYKVAKAKEKEEMGRPTYLNLKGVWLEEQYLRKYPYGSLASNVIGFINAENVGVNGIESSYNTVLSGIDGREYGYYTSDDSTEVTVKEAQNGNTVVTTFDQVLQSIVDRKVVEFNERLENGNSVGAGSKNTGVIIMNPNTGEILAESSYPNFDLNKPRDLSSYFSEEALEEMESEQISEALNSLWNNFTVTETFEPGSTVKPFTVAAGLETGTITGEETFYCSGSLHVGDYDIRCANRDGHGTQTLSEAMANSCNVAMMEIAAKMGIKEFTKYQTIFGFGTSTGIDLPGETTAAGLLYTEETMKATDLATNSFGQNFNVNMTQMVAGFSSLINGGNYYQPHVVKQIQDDSGTVLENIQPVLMKKTVSESTSLKLKSYLKAVVESGTGKGAAVEGYSVGGKTGTAEKLPRGNGNYVVSFIGAAPIENPEVVIYVVVDEPNVSYQADSGIAQRLAADIMEEAFPYLNITKVEEEE